MVRVRAIAAGTAVLAAVGLLAGCTAGTTPGRASPISEQQRTTIRTAIVDGLWAQVAAEYPEAIRPRVTVASTVPDHNWAPVIVRCLKSAGIVAYVVKGVPIYGSAGQSQLEVAVRYYSCEASHPSESQVAAYFTPALSTALYDYYLRVVRPCLLTAGAPSPASPDRSAAASLAGLAGWNPYQVIWTSNMPRRTQSYLESRCPPTPVWLDLGP